MKTIGNEAYNVLKSSGHCVPRLGNPKDYNDTIVTFKVGKEYQVISKENKEPLKVRCTQNCPISIKLI